MDAGAGARAQTNVSRCPFYKNLRPEGQREDAAFLSRQDSSMERGGGHERYCQLIPSRRGRVSFKSVVRGGLTTLQGGSHVQEYLGSRN